MPDQSTISAEVPLTMIGCSECGIAYAIPVFRYLRGFLDEGMPIWCPNGHKSERSGEAVNV